MVPIVSRIDAAGNTKLGEGPHWDHKRKCLFFVSITAGTIHKYTPASGTTTKATIEGHDGKNVSLIIPVRDKPSQFVIAVDRQLGIASWDGQSATASFKPIAETSYANGSRINDGKCDALGRVWFGTLGHPEAHLSCKNNGTFYSYRDNKVTTHFGKVRISNGLVWNKDNTKFYYIDTQNGTIDVFDFDLPTGTISNRKVFAEVPKVGFGPDGMTIDTEDNLWVAVYNGSCVLQFCGRTGKLMQTIELPAKEITSVAWGGDNLDELYVTCARVDNSLTAPVHGAIYKITNTGFKGFPMVDAVL